MAYDNGVTSCEQYEETFKGKRFANFVKDQFQILFEKRQNAKGKLFLQHGYPRQNSKVALSALKKVGFHLFELPARSPEDVLQQIISKETFEQFLSRVKQSIENIPVATINKMIDFLNKRIRLIIKWRGTRTKY